jgi:hypothetical protein
MIRSCSIFFAGLLLTACVRDKPQIPEPQVLPQSGQRIFVINEGNFGSGNGSVSLYDPLSGAVVEDVYKLQNNAELGDVVQSMTYYNSKFYVVVNNSGRIVVCNSDFKKSGQISGLASPRYLLPVSSQKAYVSDLASNFIHIVDLASNTETGKIMLSGWTEKMIMLYNTVFVTNITRDKVYAINAITDELTDSLFVGKGATSLVIDRKNKIWVLSPGDKTTATKARLTRIDPLSKTIENASELPDYGASYLCSNPGGDTLYFINEGIRRIAIADEVVTQISSAGSKSFYGLGFNPADGRIYASDAVDYSQRSNIYVYKTDGTQEKVFKAGVCANGFYFE